MFQTTKIKPADVKNKTGRRERGLCLTADTRKTAGSAAYLLGISRPPLSRENHRRTRYILTQNPTTHLRSPGLRGGRKRPLLHPQPEVCFSSEGAPVPRTRSQLLSNVVAESPQREPSNSRAAAFPTNQSRARLTPPSPISAGAARKFPELSRKSPLTRIHPPDNFPTFS